MKIDSEQLAEVYRQGRSRGSGRDACPSSDELAAAALGELPAAGLETVARHVAECSDCAEEYRVAQALSSWAAPDAARPAPRAVPRQPRPAARLALAASLAAVALGLWPLLSRSPSREPAADATRRLLPLPETLELLEPSGAVGSAAWRFRWKGLAGAEAYQVHVFTEDGIPVWTSPATRETSLLPPSQQPFAPGRYLWHVSATRGGELVARSKVAAFSFGP